MHGFQNEFQRVVVRNRIERLLVMSLILRDEVPDMAPDPETIALLRRILGQAAGEERPDEIDLEKMDELRQEREQLRFIERDFGNIFVRLQVGALFGESESLRAYCRILPIYRPGSGHGPDASLN